MSETQTQGQQQTTSAANWYDGKAAAEHVGLWQNKGWTTSDPAEVALKATQAYIEAEKFIGVRPDQLLRLPTGPTDEAGIKALWSRLGAPENADGYDFSDAKFTDGRALDKDLETTLRQAAVDARMPKDQAAALVRALVKHEDASALRAAEERQVALQADKQALAQNWGQNFTANMLVAKQAAGALGVTPEAVTALEGIVGYSKVMEMFRAIGSKIGEDKFLSIPNQGGGNPGVMTQEGAKARIEELKRDTVWRDKYLSGDAQAYREMENLSKLIAGVS